jgi:large subunit ribosomal protein L17
LFLTEQDADDYLDDKQAPKVKGRIVTTVAKAKEVRPLVERCVTIARDSLEAQREADELDTDAERLSEQWREWRASDRWQQWNQAIAPVIAARRRVTKLLGNTNATPRAVRILFDEIAPRFEDRPGGYTRILRLAKPRLGDAGTRAILEFVGQRDRVREERATAPSFEDETATEGAVLDETPEDEAAISQTADSGAEETAAAEGSAEEEKL